MTRIVVVGAGVGGLACAVRLAAAGHHVTVCEQAAAAGGKAGRRELVAAGETYRFDTGPSLLTMPWVFCDLFAATGAPLEDELELLRVEPVTRYRFADGSAFDLSADLPSAMEALEAWSPGAGADWARFLGTCAGMWRASETFLGGPPPLPPRRPRPGEPPPDPRDLVRVRPWATLRGLARSHARDPRLRMVIERFATYAGADPRRAPAVLAVAGYVEHAFGAWHVRGGLYAIVEALVRRLHDLGAEVRFDARVQGILREGRRVRGVVLGEAGAGSGAPAGVRGASGEVRAGRRGAALPADVVVWNGDALALDGLLGRARSGGRERSVSGLALLLALRGRESGTVHHEIRYPASYDAEFDDVFAARRPVRDPTLYLSTSCVTDPAEAPPGGENLFVLANAPAGAADEDMEACAARLVERLGVADRVVARARRTPADLERETGAVGGAIYGAAPHGRLAALRRPGPQVRGIRGLFRVGGTVHPGGGLPLVALSGKVVADLVGPAR